MLTVQPASAPLGGEISVPGDKSISHRALMLAGAAQGRSLVKGLGTGADIASTRTVMEALGVAIRQREEGLEIEGRACRFEPPVGVLDCGNSGTTMRLVTGLLAGQDFVTSLDGDASLRARPMQRLVAPLTGMGASVRTTKGRAPLTIEGRGLAGASHALELASAQLKSAILLAGLQARGRTEVNEPRLSRDHTEKMLGLMGVELERRDLKVALEGPALPEACQLSVPGDPSSAAFLLSAAVLVPGSRLTVGGVCLNPTRTGFIAVLKRMGADIEVEPTGEACGEPVGRVTAKASALEGTDIGADEIPTAIDELPVLAVVAAAAKGETRIWGAGELRVKESDRIAAIRALLECVGAGVQETEDGLNIEGGGFAGGGQFDAGGDHRMAMSAGVAALAADRAVSIAGADVADVSYPGFFEALAGMCR